MAMDKINNTRAVIYLNRHAHGARGLRRWARIETALAQKMAYTLIETGNEASEQILIAIERGERWFVAAGGDGTLHALINDLVRLKGSAPLQEFCLGAIGLGSSNDFHKPFSHLHLGIPLRLNRQTPTLRDVGRARFTTPDGSTVERHFLVSASLGAVAEANAFFNREDWLLRRLKTRLTDVAIGYAALKTLLRYQNISLNLHMTHHTSHYETTNLSVLKTPYLSGAFHYDTPVFPNDGRFSVNLAEGLSRIGALKQLFHLVKGQFRAQPGCHDWHVACLTVEAAAPAALEMDGEIYACRTVTFDVLPEQIHVAEAGF